MRSNHPGFSIKLPKKSIKAPRKCHSNPVLPPSHDKPKEKKISQNLICHIQKKRLAELKRISEGRVFCLICKETFSCMKSAKTHSQKKHKSRKNFQCKICKKLLGFKRNISLHMRDVHGLPKKLAKKSPKKKELNPALPKNRVKKSVYIHNWNELKETKNGRIVCLNCNKTFSGMNTAKQHYKEQHMQKYTFKCKVCNKKFRQERSIISHMRMCHGPGSKKAVDKVVQKWDWSKLRLTEANKVICLDCDETFSSMKSAKSHYKTQHMTDKNALNFICEICKKGFAVKSYLKTHIRKVHTLPKKGLSSNGHSSLIEM